MKTQLNDVVGRLSGFSRCVAILAACYVAPVLPAEIESIAWEGGDSLKVQTKGPVTFRTEQLEQGQRLRVVFSNSTLGPALKEISGQGLVKGVYPYLSDNGTSVNIDFLLTESGQLDIQKADFGFRIAATAVGKTPIQAPPVVQQMQAQPAGEKNTIKEILHAKLPGERVQITVRMSEPPSQPSTFTINNPAQIALDFPNTQVDLAKKTVDVKEGSVTNITAIGAENRTRLVVKLIRSAAFRTSVDGNNFVITVDAPSPATAEPAKVTHFAGGRKDARYQVKTVDFRRGPQGDGKIVVGLSDPVVAIDIREQAGEIVLDFSDTSIATDLQRRLDVVDFATPVQTIDTFVHGKNTRMVISPKGKYEHIAYQAGNILTVSVKPIVERPDEKKVDEFGYSGEKLSLNFQNIEARAALQVLADFTGLNFVVSDTVKGSLTLRLKDVPWDQALDLIVDTKGLAVRRKGNVLAIAPASEVVAKEKAAFEAAKSNIELEPLISELIRINYAKAEDMASLIKSIKPVAGATAQQAQGSSVLGQTAGAAQSAAGVSSNTLLSPRGQITVDARSNSVLIQDTAGKITEVRKLITQLDQPVRQVMVETRLVEASDTYADSLGVRLGHSTTRTKGATTAATSGSIGGGIFNVNLPSSGVGSSLPGSFALGFIKGGNTLDLELSALEQTGQGKIISSPRVISANQQKAVIEQGQERVFNVVSNNVVTVTTKKASLKLEVTPQITPDDRVNLDVLITKDNFVPPVSDGLLNIKQIQTQVLLDNGETVVIGGIYEQDRNVNVAQVPFFGDLPLLGWLFKNREFRDNKTELLVFLTPRILNSHLSLR